MTLDKITAHHRELFNIAKNITKNEQKAKDLLQDFYLTLMENPQEIQNIYGFAKVSMRNRWYGELKKANKFKDFGDEFPDFEQEKVTEEQRGREIIQEKLQKIPFVDREVLMLHQEGSQRELSKKTGVCRDRLRFYKNRAFKKLKADCLKDEEFKELEIKGVSRTKGVSYISDKEIAEIENEIYNNI